MTATAKLFEFVIPNEVRAAIRPLVRNRLLELESRLVPELKIALGNFVEDVITQTFATTSIKSRTGKMKKSVEEGYRVYGSKISNIRAVYRALPYVLAHEYGAIIRPTRARVLTVPLPAALRADGTPKFRSPRSWKRYGTFSYTSKETGQGYLAYKNARGELVLLYMYLDRVRIRPRLGLRKTHYKMLHELMRQWGLIIADELANIDIFSLIENPKRKARIISNRSRQITRVIRPKAIR